VFSKYASAWQGLPQWRCGHPCRKTDCHAHLKPTSDSVYFPPYFAQLSVSWVGNLALSDSDSTSARSAPPNGFAFGLPTHLPAGTSFLISVWVKLFQYFKRFRVLFIRSPQLQLYIIEWKEAALAARVNREEVLDF